MRTVAFVLFALTFSGCEQLAQEQPKQKQPNVTAPAPNQANGELSTRFAFPAKSNPFAETSVALDTVTGQLCKTYAWKDTDQLPKRLPLCSEISRFSQIAFTGATKVYRGFNYSFNGTKWVKGSESLSFNKEKQEIESWSDDQYDPQHLLSKGEKAKRTLTQDQIQRVADQFGVTYGEAWVDANQQGYQVPPKRK